MERSSKLRSNTNRGPSSGNGPGGTDIEGLSQIRGRSMNQTHQLQMTQYGLLSNNTLNNNQSTGQASNLPKIQNLQTARHKSKDKQRLKSQASEVSDISNSTNQQNITLEVRSKEAQTLMMNQSQTNSFKNQQGTPKITHTSLLPSIVTNTSPRKKPDLTSEHLSLSAEKEKDPMNVTNKGFSNKIGHQKGKSQDITSNRQIVQFKEQTLSNDQLNQVLQAQIQNPNFQAQASVFGNYMMKVVQSVERRKQKQHANLVAIANLQTQKLSSLMDIDPNNNNGNSSLLGGNLSKRASHMTNIALQNFNNQIIPQNNSTQVDIKRRLTSKGSNIIEAIEEKRDFVGGSVVSFKDINSGARGSIPSSIGETDVLAGTPMANKNNQVAVVGFKSVFAEPKATEQVAFLLKEAQRKDKIFIPLERAPDIDSGLMYKEMKNAPDNHAGIVVFSKQGFVTVGKAKNATSNFISNEDFITDGVNKFILRDLPFYKKFHAMKIFKQWKYIMKWNAYTRKREQLANNLHLAKPMFSEHYTRLAPLLNNIRTLPFIDIKQNITYGKKQQQLLEDKCTDQLQINKKELNVTLNKIKDYLEDIKTEILEDDHRYEQSVKERRMMDIIKQSKHGGEDLIMFSKARRQKEIEEEQFKIQKQRHGLYDKFVQFVLKIVCANLIELQFENKRSFKDIFRDQKLGPQFEVAVCFNNLGVLDTDPSMQSHKQSFYNVFSNIEVAIYQNQALIDFVNDLVGLLFVEKSIYYKNLFEHMKKVLNENPMHQANHDAIFDTLEKDINRCKDYLEQFVSLQEIYDFANDWENNDRDKQISLEMSFYKETWMEMDKYADIVDKIPTSNTKLGTILVETQSLKKYLAELPKKVIDSIRSNVTNTMETETKSLREELSKTSEILDQLPGSLNVYVEQVNTIKYVKEKEEEFSQKFSTINKLHQLCKQDNIKVSLNLQQAIEEVSHLYETLPKLQKRAQDGLNANKDTMEKIMHSSSLVLSKKIKAFEKKYVETYLQDRSRIEDCADTLEELFKRSKAIHEIRSKVILYKEFLKLLYEDDPKKEEKMKTNKLQCAEDYEFVADLHKQTIKLWKMLLYWRKRRHMCYNTPFLTLDMNKVIRSINKINRYFEEKLSKNDFLKDKSRPLYKVVMLQVKETSLIIEFLKDLRRESLQQRHWLQIFQLIKAPHLKNSITFTIVNLREYHVQNYREEISKIIEHANTELKYERVFRSIKDEWEKHELKIIPYKETMDSYILVGTESLSSSIEENLTTLENISQSKYAIHIKQDIEDWVKTLKQMLKNLEIWVNAQHHWINLDPILQSSQQLAEILRNDAMGIGYGNNKDLDEQTSEFLDIRNQFKRIMWSSFKKPKATYNLMIKSRIDVFEKLIKHFTVLQKKVHDFLEERRRAFPRFFFLTDSQFLEFLTLANSNQDFNEYINVLFQGAHKLFINRILGKEPMKDTVQLENFIQKELQTYEQTKDEQAANLEAQQNLVMNLPLKDVKANPSNSVIISTKEIGVTNDTKPIDDDDDDQNSDDSSQLMSPKTDKTPKIDMMTPPIPVPPTPNQQDSPIVAGFKQLVTPPENQNDIPENQVEVKKAKEVQISESFEVLGMISLNKELFLFEKPIPMVNGVEKWLVDVEQSMQQTISKMLSYAVSSFPNLPLDEWVLDYPQQIILTTLHLILSHEINEVLEQNAYQEASLNEQQQESQRTIGDKELSKRSPAQNSTHQPGGSQRDQQQSALNSVRSGNNASKKSSVKDSDEDDDDGEAMADYNRRKNELKAQQLAEEEENRKKMAEENRRKLEMSEVPRDPEREKRHFIDEMFGKDFLMTSRLLIEEQIFALNKSKDDSIDDFDDKNKDKKLMESKKTEFKEIVMTNLNKKNLQGINLRIHFWMNQIMKSLNRNMNGLQEKSMIPAIKMQSIQKMVMKSIIAFLVYQRDIVDNLMDKNIQDIDSFDWQSQIRLFWTGIEPQCKVLCGGWSVCQQNEYLGSSPRLTLTPLTNRYLVFISSALREKSAVLFNSSETNNSVAGDIFEEFSSICMTPFKKVICNPVLHLKPLMQCLNGAALASFWVLFQNLDQLSYNYLQTFNKELQMLQQQFIFSDLAGLSEDKDKQNLIKRDLFLQHNGTQSGILENGQNSQQVSQNNLRGISQSCASESDLGSNKSRIHLKGHQSYYRAGPTSFGIFGTITNNQNANINKQLLNSLGASFRVLAFCRFNERILFKTIMKIEGFDHYSLVARLSQEFLNKLYDDLYKDKVDDQNEDNGKHLLSLRDLRLVIKLACLIKDQEHRVFHNQLIEERFKNQLRNLRAVFAIQKVRELKILEYELLQRRLELQQIEDKQIEYKCVMEGLRLVCRQKLFALDWLLYSEKNPNAKQESDQYSLMEIVERKIAIAQENNFQKQMRDDHDELLEIHRKIGEKQMEIDQLLDKIKQMRNNNQSINSSLALTQKEMSKKGIESISGSIGGASQLVQYNPKSSYYKGGPLIRKKSISNNDVYSRYSSNVGILNLKHNQDKVTEERLFVESITKVLKEIIDKLNFHKSNAQLRNCINVLDLFRRTKAIAFVGPVCSGKTSILKIVSNALHVAFKVKLRTSVVNTATMTAKDLYGAIEAFNSHPRENNNVERGEIVNDNDFSRSGILKIILDVFEKERLQSNLKKQEEGCQKTVQSIFFDSCGIDKPLSECLMEFIEKTNKREDLRATSTEYMMDYSLTGEIKATGMNGDERIPIILPNGNVIQIPSDVYLFFETTSLKDASPPFISKVGLIVTEQDDLSWISIFKRHQNIFLKKQAEFFKEMKFDGAVGYMKECSEEFLIPFLEKVTQQQKIAAWPYFNPKAATLQLFNLLNCVFYKLKDTIKQRRIEEDEQYEVILKEVEKDLFWSNSLLCTVWSFGAQLSKELRKPFEELFVPFKRRFNLNMSSSATAQSQGVRNRFTLFDIYYDPESLQWELLQENIDYKLKLQYDPLSNELLIPTTEVSQSLFLMDMFIGTGTKYEDNILDNKHFRALGPSGSGKSFVVNSYMKRINGEHKFQIIQIPMTAYITIEKIKETMEKLFVNKRRNLLEPRDKERPIIFIVEDVHLQSNLQVNILEFLRTWCMSKGFYDIQQGFFKGIGNFTSIVTENSDYRTNEQTQFPGRSDVNSRFLFYTNTIYLDDQEYGGLERYKSFTQLWFTSKIWNTSRLLNKYYILITNTLLAFIEKLKRTEALHSSSILKLTNFHLFQKFCSNIVTYTITMDENHDIPQGMREEDVAANIVMYELMRVYGDRQLRSTQRTTLIQKILECVKSEFVGRTNITQQSIEGIILGNYHQRLPGACVKFTQVNPKDHTTIKELIRKKLSTCSNNQFLESFLDANTSIKDIFRISRVLFKEMQHLILAGPSGSGKLEYLQLSAVLNDSLIYEINCSRLNESFKFIAALKRTILSIVGINKNSFILISETQLRDPIYIDFIHGFMKNMCNKFENSVIWGDLEFKKSLINIEKDLYRQQTIKRALEPTEDQFLIQAMRKMQRNIHFVLMIEDFQTYFEWVQLFPSLENLCEVMFIDELSSEGYKQLTQNFFTIKGVENQIYQDQKLVSALVEIRQIVKNTLVNTFYSPQMLQFTCSEDFMGISNVEYLFNSENKLNGYLFSDGNFKIRDPSLRQYNYNLPVDITTLYKSRYIMFLELFRYLYDFGALSLLVKKNYYEAFLRKTAEFNEFFKDIKVTKSSLHSHSSTLTIDVATMRDKVNRLKDLIDEREYLIIKKTEELQRVELELSINQEEVDSQMEDRDRAINEVLDHFEKVNGSEFMYVISQFSKFQERENNVLELLGILIEKNSNVQNYDKKEHLMYFQDRDDLVALLDERRDFTYDEQCLTRIKDVIAMYTQNDFKDRPLFRLLFQYFVTLYKKLNLRNSMAMTYSRIKNFHEQIGQIQFTLNYSKNYIIEKKADLSEIQEKYDKLCRDEKQMSMKIEEAEISHMRTNHIIEQIDKYSDKVINKLIKTKKRIETLLGDSLIMAASVVYLGPLSMKERKLVRLEMANYLNATTAGLIKCGAYWTDKGGANNSKILRSVLKDLGVNGGNPAEDLILSQIPQGILSQETLIESMFTLMFAPSCPYIIDPTGQLQEFFQTQLLEKMQVRKIFASDEGVNDQIEQVLRSAKFACLNDVNDCSSNSYGLSQEEPLLSRLAHITHNGFEFDPEMLQNPYIKNALQSIHMTHTSVNKRLTAVSGKNQGDSYSFYQVQIFSPKFDFQLNSDYMAKATMMVAIDEDEVISQGNIQVTTNSSWIDIKEIMLKHFLPEERDKLVQIKKQINRLERKRTEINKTFENAFLMSTQETLHKINEYSQLKQSVEEIRHFEEEKKKLNEVFQKTLSNHPLLSSYANVISLMFQTLKKISKITGEVTYSWKSFTSILDQVFAKTVRELTHKVETQQESKNQQSSTSIIIDSQGRLAIRSTKIHANSQETILDFTLDEEYFANTLIPSIYGIIASSIKYQLVPLFNLILAVKLAYKKKDINELEVEYFFKQLLLLKNFENWRDLESNFIKMDDRVEKSKFMGFKRDLIKIYPEFGRKIIDIIEKEITNTFTYKQANHTLNFKIFNKSSDFTNLKLFQQINVGFICPDHEFKTKLTQLVYEQLSSVFNFAEEPLKFHEFLRLASWTQPIALFSHYSMNTINSVSSVASFYGLNLEILRSSDLPKSDGGDLNIQHQNENLELKHQIQGQLIDFTHGGSEGHHKFIKDAATYQRDPYQDVPMDDKKLQSVYLPKVYIEQKQTKETLRKDERTILGAYQAQDPLLVIEKSAKTGNWVFISSLSFPVYWHKIVALLNKLRSEGKIKNTFRLMIDLQGYSQNEIPDSFLFEYSVSFCLTEKSNSDHVENLQQDVWSSILNPQILSRLTDYKPVFPEDIKLQLAAAIVSIMKAEVRQSNETDQFGRDQTPREQLANEEKNTQNIIKQQQLFIKDDQQRELLNQYMVDNLGPAEVQAQKFNEEMKYQDAFIAENNKNIDGDSQSSTTSLRARARRFLESNDASKEFTSKLSAENPQTQQQEQSALNKSPSNTNELDNENNNNNQVSPPIKENQSLQVQEQQPEIVPQKDLTEAIKASETEIKAEQKD